MILHILSKFEISNLLHSHTYQIDDFSRSIPQVDRRADRNARGQEGARSRQGLHEEIEDGRTRAEGYCRLSIFECRHIRIWQLHSRLCFSFLHLPNLPISDSSEAASKPHIDRGASERFIRHAINAPSASRAASDAAASGDAGADPTTLENAAFASPHMIHIRYKASPFCSHFLS